MILTIVIHNVKLCSEDDLKRQAEVVDFMRISIFLMPCETMNQHKQDLTVL